MTRIALSNTSSGARLARPYRGVFGQPRPDRLAGIPLPPGRMPSHNGLRALKAWRYVGVYGPELMLCAAVVRIGPARQSFWAVWDRGSGRLLERTSLGGRAVALRAGRLTVNDSAVQLDIRLGETNGVEAVCPAGESYAWTRKQGGVPARGVATIEGERHPVEARAVIDDTAAYYPRRTAWQWSAGVGLSIDGREVAWNLVAGVNDPPSGSERTVWIDGRPFEPPPCAFAPDLRGVDALRFDAEAVRERADNLVLVRSRYRQPFGSFSGQLPTGVTSAEPGVTLAEPGVTLAEGYGVMEEHEAWW